MTAAPVIVSLTAAGAERAGPLKRALEGSEHHGLASRVTGADTAFEAAGAHLRQLFRSGRPIVGICSAAILIRALAPVIADKRSEPPVIAVPEDGSSVVPLLGAHRGGLALARRIGNALGVRPALTTAGDLAFGVSLDDPPPGWRLANPKDAKAFVAALLAGASVRLEGEAPWLEEGTLPLAADGELVLRAGMTPAEGSKHCLVYHPARLAVGVGCERDTEPGELVALVEETLGRHGLAGEAVAGIFSLDLKADEPAVHALAEALQVPARFFDAATLEKERDRLATPSETVYRAVGCHGVAEGAALAAAGPQGVLKLAKQASKRATCAVAEAPAPLDAASLGAGRGHLAVVGLGPGDPRWLTGEAASAIAEATDLVGYELYLDLAGPLGHGKSRHAFHLGEEEKRVAHALDLAASGRRVALLSSGDPGIYAMAALVFELIDRVSGAGGRGAGWSRVAVTIVPGLSALQAAAARAGAPLGHDFAAVSLSDLMTPWTVIRERLEAAARAGFVIALYNPASRERRWQQAEALALFQRYRAPDTPVIIARNLGRRGESVDIEALAEVDAESIDMLSILLIGASTTRAIRRMGGGSWVYTPRGYGSREEPGKTGT